MFDYKGWRQKHGFKQAEAGKLVSRSASLWSFIERGKDEMNEVEASLVKRLLMHYDVGTYEAVESIAKALTASQILNFRLKRKMTQDEAGDLIACGPCQWSLMERGKPYSFRYALSLACLIYEEQQAQQKQTREPIQEQADQFVSDSHNKVVPYDFDGQTIQVIEADEIIMTDRQLGEALGYAQPTSAIAHLVADRMDELQHHEVIVELTMTGGYTKKVRAWRERGITLITCFSDQPKAKVFRAWAADTLYKVRRQHQNNNSDQSNLETLAKLMGLRSEQALSDAKAYADNLLKQQTAELAEVKSAVAAAPSQAADEVLARMQALEAHKARLHDVVHSIVAKAKTLDQNDPDAQYWAQYANAWRSIHRYAQPPVSKLAGYTHPDQIEHAILGGEAILARLGGPIGSKQMAMDLQGVAV